MVAIVWRDTNGNETTSVRLPLTPVVRALVHDLHLILTLLPTGFVTIEPKALPECDLASLIGQGGLPQARLEALVRTMLAAVASAPDPSDAPDLMRLADDLERAAQDVRGTLERLKASG